MSYIEEPVHIEATAPAEHVAAVEEAFARAGFRVAVAADYERKGVADLLPWVVLVILLSPIKPFFDAFSAKAGERAADDAYDGLKQLLRDIRLARSGAGTGEGSIRISDPERTNVELPSPLPDEAVEALRDIDWNEVRGAWLVWDPQRKTWRDPTKRGG